MINYTLSQISTFLAVVDTRSFRLAAERLRVTPPAVSARVRELEDRLGVRLFHRTTRSVVPTLEGTRLATAAVHALGELHGAADALRDEAALRRGRFSVATLPSVAATILPPAMADFRRRHPKIEVGMVDAYAGIGFGAILRGEAAFGLLAAPPAAERDLLFDPLFRDVSVAVVPVGHPWARRRSIRLAEVVTQPVLLTAVGTSMRAMVDAAFRSQGLEVRAAHEAMNLTSLLALAEAGFGITFVPRMFVMRLDLSRLKMIALAGQPMAREIGIVTPRGRSLSPAAAAFRDFLTDRYAEPRRVSSPRTSASASR